ncbi:MAG: aminomethyl-transferring glycine dehydrogenase subunit GcvPA [Sneathiellaceae bacterium]
MRYLPLTADDRAAMLARVGAASVDELYVDVPQQARLADPLDLPDHSSEFEVEREIGAFAARNLSPGAVPSFLGAGAYRHHIPASVDHLIQRSEFLTSYTPYQPEISQGTLQALFEFQSQVALLTGMEVANASMYDGATALGEAALMAKRITRRGKVVLAPAVHPHYAEVVRTLCGFTGDPVAVCGPGDDTDPAGLPDGETACLIVQYPDLFGRVRDLRPYAEAAHKAGALLVVAVTEVVALGLLTPPGEMGADIVACEGQSIGVPLSYGGPHVGLFATRQKFLRQIPGRLCGETVDQDGRRGYVLTLSAREQHIRRERATSNICTNAGLCALAFCIHLTLLGEAGLRKLAELNHARAVQTAEALEALEGVTLETPAFFNEFALRLPRPAAEVVEALAERGILAGVPLSRLAPEASDLADVLLVAATELTRDSDIAALAAGLKEVL